MNHRLYIKIGWIGSNGQELIHEPPIRFHIFYEAFGGLGAVVAATSCNIFYFIRFMWVGIIEISLRIASLSNVGIDAHRINGKNFHGHVPVRSILRRQNPFKDERCVS